jgi:hypothetical protein
VSLERLAEKIRGAGCEDLTDGHGVGVAAEHDDRDRGGGRGGGNLIAAGEATVELVTSTFVACGPAMVVPDPLCNFRASRRLSAGWRGLQPQYPHVSCTPCQLRPMVAAVKPTADTAVVKGAMTPGGVLT